MTSTRSFLPSLGRTILAAGSRSGCDVRHSGIASSCQVRNAGVCRSDKDQATIHRLPVHKEWNWRTVHKWRNAYLACEEGGLFARHARDIDSGRGEQDVFFSVSEAACYGDVDSALA
jgi:hypothetical protein